MSEYKSKRNWINNAPLTIVDLGSLHPPASGSLLVKTATASPRSAALQSENPFCVICLKVNVSSPFDLSVHSFVSYVRNYTIANFNHVCFTKLPFGEKWDIL